MARVSILRNTLEGAVPVAVLHLDHDEAPVRVEVLDTPHAAEVTGIAGPVVGSRQTNGPVSREQGKAYVDAVVDSLSRATYWQTRQEED